MNLIFYTKKLNPRIEYIAKHLFSGVLGYSIQFTSDLNCFVSSDKIRIQYGGSQRIEVMSFYIPMHPFMLENDIRAQDIAPGIAGSKPTLFSLNEVEADLSFDFLSMAFYLISRYEEYLPFESDNHDRFVANQSHAFKYGFLQKPLVDQWLTFINDQLVERFQFTPVKSLNYTFIPTIDVDFGWAYLHKSSWRNLGGALKDLLKGQFGDLSTRLAVLKDREPDPYYKFDFLNQLHQRNHCNAIYFILFGAYGHFDKNTAPEHPAMRKLVQQISDNNQIGIHPSYTSNSDINQLKKEITDLAIVSNQDIKRSRQHFLKLTLPETYQQLLSLGVRADYTMGYAEALGFRASTCHPFPWYNLKDEKETELTIFPFQVMDVSLKNYLGLTPETALESCRQIVEEVKAVNGTLISIWHNSSFSSLMGWADWQKVYESFVKTASKNARGTYQA